MLLLLALLACVPEADPLDDGCIRSCDQLVNTCGIEAYPDLSSCHDGCRYAVQEGADIASYASCVELATCDPFALVACEHDFGLD
jgi:hypothetical protein